MLHNQGCWQHQSLQGWPKLRRRSSCQTALGWQQAGMPLQRAPDWTFEPLQSPQRHWSGWVLTTAQTSLPTRHSTVGLHGLSCQPCTSHAYAGLIGVLQPFQHAAHPLLALSWQLEPFLERAAGKQGIPSLHSGGQQVRCLLPSLKSPRSLHQPTWQRSLPSAKSKKLLGPDPPARQLAWRGEPFKAFLAGSMRLRIKLLS